MPRRSATRTLACMDRRYICPSCTVKWFIPANQPQAADLTHCAACGETLVPFVGTPPETVLRARLAEQSALTCAREASR